MPPTKMDICQRVYLVWDIIIAIGFITTHFHQLPDINNLWLVLSLIGLGYMAFSLFQIRWQNRQLLYIGLIWLLTIGFGLFISLIAFTYEPLADLTLYLGIFWLLLMGVGLAFNGLVDRSRVYFVAGGIEILAGLVCYWIEPWQALQYLVAGAVGALAMIGLIIYR